MMSYADDSSTIHFLSSDWLKATGVSHSHDSTGGIGPFFGGLTLTPTPDAFSSGLARASGLFPRIARLSGQLEEAKAANGLVESNVRLAAEIKELRFKLMLRDMGDTRDDTDIYFPPSDN